MKIAVVSNHSSRNVELARLTSGNHWDYAARHGYDSITLRMAYEESFTWGLTRLREILEDYDVVFSIGSDVLITNPSLSIESMLPPDPTKHVVLMAREIEGRSPVNNDVAIWVAGNESDLLLQRLRADRDKWKSLPNLWQSYIADTPDIFSKITVLPPRALCATDQTGEWHWHDGDFLCHFLGGTIESKIERVNEFRAKHP